MFQLEKTLVIFTLCVLAIVPQAYGAEVELDNDSVTVMGLGAEALMDELGFTSFLGSSEGAHLGWGIIGLFENSLYTTYFDKNGYTFPDSSKQQSAAYTKAEIDSALGALTPVEAWPMVCKADAVTGIVPLYPASPATLVCRSPQGGVPGGDISSVAGVPAGYFFVVTDVLATCGIGVNCDGVFFWLSRRNIIDGDTDLETWDLPLSNTTNAGDKVLSLQFAGPLMILEEGDYLVGFGSLTTSGEGHAVFAQVMGYLTANPERFGR
jgi:hypothetical protein